jgi:hypothetical protein
MAISERTDLGAHVDLCAERYRALEQKLDNLEERMDKIEEHIIVIRTTLMTNQAIQSTNKDSAASAATEKAQGTIITIGTAFGVALLTGLLTVLVQFILK